MAQLIERWSGDRIDAVRDSPPAESLCCVLEQDTLIAA